MTHPPTISEENQFTKKLLTFLNGPLTLPNPSNDPSPEGIDPQNGGNDGLTFLRRCVPPPEGGHFPLLVWSDKRGGYWRFEVNLYVKMPRE